MIMLYYTDSNDTTCYSLREIHQYDGCIMLCDGNLILPKKKSSNTSSSTVAVS